MLLVHSYCPASAGASEVKERVAVRVTVLRGVGVSLSHLNPLSTSGTSSDSSPIRSHVRENVCPSIGDPLGVISSVSGGTASICNNYIQLKYALPGLPVTSIVNSSLLTVLPLLIASHTYCPLLEGEVCLRGVKERVADVSPDISVLSLRH